jgi:CelD/BcsL family acetyltransferase involved in cellulose biosynthesis
MCLRIATGDAARETLRDPEFILAWKALHTSCEWATTLQSPEFVDTWYRVYDDLYDPILVFDLPSEGRCRGLLTLAQHRESGSLVVAGDHQAEYQVWLADRESSRAFIERALQQLLEHHSYRSLTFRYLPPATPLDGIATSGMWVQRSILKRRNRPLLAVSDELTVEEFVRGRKRLRTKRNKLARLGSLEFEHVTDHHRLDAIFGEIIAFHDLRQGAVNGITPFASDTRKRDFHLELLRDTNVLHVSVLRLNKEVIAAHMGVCGKGQVHLGILSHSPFRSRESPGALLLLDLARHLQREGYDNFDLTPDGQYKERFADHHDQVHLLTVYSTRLQCVRRRAVSGARSVVKKSLRALPIDEASLNRTVQLMRTQVRTGSHLHRIRAIQSWLHRQEAVVLLACEIARNQRHSGRPRMVRDQVADLLHYQQRRNGQTTKAFLATCLSRLEGGGHCYTDSNEEHLERCAWFTDRPDTAFLSEFGHRFAFPEGSALILDVRGGPDARVVTPDHDLLRDVVADATESFAIRRLYLCVRNHDPSWSEIIASLGFEHVRTFHERVWFGSVKRWHTTPETT